jgi:hypothetical protein
MSETAEPSGDQIVTMLFHAAMSGDEVKWAQENEIDHKLIQEYIAYLEKVLRLIKARASN